MLEAILAMSWQEITMIVFSTLAACSAIGALVGKKKLANLTAAIFYTLIVVAVYNYATVENWAIQSYRYAIYNTDVGDFLDVLEDFTK